MAQEKQQLIQSVLPDNVRRLAAGELFQFRCHPGIGCFTDCCRELELALTPYDVLRLRHGLRMTSSEFLERHAVIEQEEGDAFPRVYLGMVDDGRASCPFVTAAGCSVYGHRPGACRIYPLGRAAFQTESGGTGDYYVLITESHCHGFSEPLLQGIDQWIKDQGLAPYNEFNDLVMTILQHDMVKSGSRFTEPQIKKYITALYDLDKFRGMIRWPGANGSASFVDEFDRKAVMEDDARALKFSIKWLKREFFGE